MGYNVISCGRIPSTQLMATDMVADGSAQDLTVITASSQTAGRGRNARKWISDSGNLYASFIYKAGARRPTLAYSFAVAAAETLLSFDVPVQIKWPNDLLADGKKISGTLLEYCRDFLIVGIGINIKSNPQNAPYKTAKTDDYAPGLTPTKVLGRLIECFEKWRGKDFPHVRQRWMELAIDMNSPVNYHGAGAVYCGLSDTGAMILRRGGKYELVYGDEMSI